MEPLFARRSRRADHNPVIQSRDYGVGPVADRVATLEADLAAERATSARLAEELAAARTELRVSPTPDPVLLRIAFDGPASTEVIAAEIGLTVTDVAARLGHAIRAGIVGCVDTDDAMIWHLVPELGDR